MAEGQIRIQSGRSKVTGFAYVRISDGNGGELFSVEPAKAIELAGMLIDAALEAEDDERG